MSALTAALKGQAAAAELNVSKAGDRLGLPLHPAEPGRATPRRAAPGRAGTCHATTPTSYGTRGDHGCPSKSLSLAARPLPNG
jgi:hypothetical protein